MRVFSVIYRPDTDTYYLYGMDGKRIIPAGHAPGKRDPGMGVKYGFSFHDEYNNPQSVEWGEFLSSLELEDGSEYFRQAELGTGNMQDIVARVTSYWLDRGKTENPPLPNLVRWSRDMMVDPQRHTGKVSKLYTGKEAEAALQTIFARYMELVKDREFQNYGHYWPNADRIQLLKMRLVEKIKFKEIAKKMGRTNAACRAQYGRIRRGEDELTLELQDWELLREAMPLGMFPSRKETTSDDLSASGEENRVEPVLPGEGAAVAAG